MCYFTDEKFLEVMYSPEMLCIVQVEYSLRGKAVIMPFSDNKFIISQLRGKPADLATPLALPAPEAQPLIGCVRNPVAAEPVDREHRA